MLGCSPMLSDVSQAVNSLRIYVFSLLPCVLVRCSASHMSARVYAHRFALFERPPALMRPAQCVWISNDQTVKTHLFAILQDFPGTMQYTSCRTIFENRILAAEKVGGYNLTLLSTSSHLRSSQAAQSIRARHIPPLSKSHNEFPHNILKITQQLPHRPLT